MARATRLSSEVAPGIFAIPVSIPYPFKYVNCYLLMPGPGVSGGPVLVDCALDTPEARSGLEAALQEHGLGFGDLEHLVITHHHPDHYGLAGLIEAQGPTVWMLDVEKARGHIFWTEPEEMTRSGQELFYRHGVHDGYLSDLGKEMAKTRSRVHPARNLRTFGDGQTLELAGMRLRVVWTPGHADGHAMLLRESDGVLLAGDQILERISPNIGLWAYSYPNPLQHYFESLEKTAALGASLALPGHYRPIRDIAGRVAELKAHHRERLGFLLGLMDSTPQTCWQLSLGLFPGDLNLAQRRFAWSETLAHLEYLVAEGLVKRLELDGIVHYSRS
ncbi:MBL fold metallo-hydrolase [Meiothermus ruber]|uniref:Beta-lactamase domain protein n=1 Tax=Meiothermus ruber (strain ATCC 35948 / DSM 1279 / VKM B-1258 / 21) TaxID=504728 RepID=D3PRW9_MEIRD|nr:MBL fold metallo-hydrolase [Meiothermus ruber]ADD28202.1 beta-lactamase domain protein [Meiothermus ruber DSM 1279]AGK06360.1 beta-lactamase domain-containing protein [Meiothermus ruber DSM 1279]MCL6528915.1 MBL fold metallo-hydrolase [Meiothermus ruber]GAO75143.1 beta-lactamase domain-containing protein [Meiothermus ruber H328]